MDEGFVVNSSQNIKSLIMIVARLQQGWGVNHNKYAAVIYI